MAEAVRAGAEVYSALRRELSGRKLSTGLGDEGGFAPEITEPEEVLRLLVQAISDAGYKTGADGVSIALDLAASEFRQPDGRYQVAGDLLTSADMIDRLAAITEQFPVHLDRGRPRARTTRTAGSRSPRAWATPPSWSATTSSAPTRPSSPAPSRAASATPR